MIADTIKERLRREPFQRFSVRTSSGKRYTIHNPDLVVMMKSEIFIAAPNSDRFVQLPYLHIAGIEGRSNGNGHGGTRRPKSR
jgi:hypothetical protein